MSSSTPEESAGLAAVRAWCGWHIAPSKTETVRVEGDGGRVMLLPSLHVTDVDEITNEAGSPVTSYKWRENGILRGWWACHDLYSVRLTHGYETLPSELTEVINQIDAAGVGTRSLASKSVGPFSESYGAADLEAQPLSVRSIIARYALPSRP